MLFYWAYLPFSGQTTRMALFCRLRPEPLLIRNQEFITEWKHKQWCKLNTWQRTSCIINLQTRFSWQFDQEHYIYIYIPFRRSNRLSSTRTQSQLCTAIPISYKYKVQKHKVRKPGKFWIKQMNVKNEIFIAKNDKNGDFF